MSTDYMQLQGQVTFAYFAEPVACDCLHLLLFDTGSVADSELFQIRRLGAGFYSQHEFTSDFAENPAVARTFFPLLRFASKGSIRCAAKGGRIIKPIVRL